VIAGVESFGAQVDYSRHGALVLGSGQWLRSVVVDTQRNVTGTRAGSSSRERRLMDEGSEV